MTWLRAHPYVSALCAAIILLAIGTIIVARQATHPIENRAGTWGSGNIPLLNPTGYQSAPNTPSQDQPSLMSDVLDGPPYTYTPPSASNTAVSDPNFGSYDIDSFIALITKGAPPKATSSASTDDTFLSAYAFIPRGLLSTTSPASTRSDTQQKLYDYGNDIGSSIESFEQQHSNTPQLLKEQVEDRSDPGKAAAVVNIGRALQDIGNSLLAMEEVPPIMASAHKALAQSYVEIGKNLALVPGATGDSAFIQAIQTYNASADTFTKNYVQIATLFSAHGVVFSSTDAGSVFTFTPSGF